MKALILLCLFGTVFSIQEEYGVGQRKLKVSDKLFLERQRDLLRLFQFINQPENDPDHLNIAKTYSIEENIDSYVNSTAVKKFVGLFKQGFLKRGEIFSIFSFGHLEQAIALFKLLYYARDYETFYNTAIWARNNVNEGLFLYSFSTALVHREDTFGYVLPPIYEIYPFYFFNGQDLDRAQRYKQQYTGGNKVYTIYSNYSEYYVNADKELYLSYYLEDVGLNAFYYYCNVYYPFWMHGVEFKLKNDRRGEQYYYLYQQLLARYYLERLSNDLGEVGWYRIHEPLKNGYTSFLRYPNGLDFPNRPSGTQFTETFANLRAYTKSLDYERRIRDTVDAGYVLKKNGKSIDLLSSDQTDLLGTLMEANPDSPHPNFYGPWQIYARQLLGNWYQPLHDKKVVPSVLEHFETAQRDPVFYQLYNKLVVYIQHYKKFLPAYTYNELNFPGVKIEKVDFDRLFTYFDSFDSDVTNAVWDSPDASWDSFKVKIRQQRLNHKPFTYKLKINSEKTEEAIVRVYLGPKYDERGRTIEINENRLNFVELDIFRWKLQPGENLIERNSREFYWFVPDRTTFRDLYKKVVEAAGNTEQFQLDSSEAFYGFPNRLLLPKGKREGQVFQVYVIVNKYQPPGRQEVQQDYYFHKVGTGMNYMDNYAFGFPFDRSIVSSDFRTPNSQFLDVVVYHKNVDELNSSQAQEEL